MKFKDVFNFKLVAQRAGLVVGVSLRLFGIDFSVMASLDPRSWSLLHLSVLEPSYKVLVMLQVAFAALYIGRNEALYD